MVSQMFGDSTFQFRFDDDDDSTESLVGTNPNLPAALERLHHAVTRSMHWHCPVIPLPIIPDAEESSAPCNSSILVETIDEHTQEQPLVSTPREPLLLAPRESTPREPPSRESPTAPSVSWMEPQSVTRPHREITPENVPTRSSQLPLSPSLRRSNQHNLGQGPNRLIHGQSDKINLQKGPSCLDPGANLAGATNHFNAFAVATDPPHSNMMDAVAPFLWPINQDWHPFMPRIDSRSLTHSRHPIQILTLSVMMKRWPMWTETFGSQQQRKKSSHWKIMERGQK
jgi:hypothetical protein